MYALKKLTDGTHKNTFYYEILNSANQKGKVSSNTEKLHKESFLKKKTANYRWFY